MAAFESYETDKIVFGVTVRLDRRLMVRLGSGIKIDSNF
jgi:hypothetical protein